MNLSHRNTVNDGSRKAHLRKICIGKGCTGITRIVKIRIG
uniref:Uncharacterized protein n=1 Tax=Lepeophtheirus salmonis TaxID=72036 RepID=A0A0K2VE80_LEPSM